MIWWTFDLASDRPVFPVEGPEQGYPLKDADGRKMYMNSHFRTEREAWAHALADARAGLSFALSDRQRAERALEEANTTIVESAADVSRLIEAAERRGLALLEGEP